MTIEFTCPAGHRLTAPESKAGRKVRCPKCNQVATVPGDVPDRALEDGEVAEAGTGKESRVAKKGKSAKRPPVPPPLPTAKQTKGAKEETAAAKKPPPPTAKSPSPRPPSVKPAQEREANAAKLPPEPPSKESRERDRRRRRQRRRHQQQQADGSAPSPGKKERPRPAEPEQPPSPPRRRPRRRTKRMGPHVYVPDHGRIQSLQWLSLILAAAVLFSIGPAALHVDLEIAPGWARAVLLMAAAEAVLIAWMLASPDWSSVWVAMLGFGCVTTAYAVVTAVTVATPLNQPMPLGLGEIRGWSSKWFASVLAIQALATYLCGRAATRWRHTFRLEMAGRGSEPGSPDRPTL